MSCCGGWRAPLWGGCGVPVVACGYPVCGFGGFGGCGGYGYGYSYGYGYGLGWGNGCGWC